MISNRNRSWLRATSKLAEKSSFPLYRMAAIAVKGGKPVSFGLNRYSPAILKDRRYVFKKIHAELDCTLGSSVNLRGAEVYVAGLSRGNGLCCSKPCSHCLALLTELGVKRVYYYDKGKEPACIDLRGIDHV